MLYTRRVMVSERLKRRIDRLLDEAEEAADRREWATVRDLAGRALRLDGSDQDALGLIKIAEDGEVDSEQASPGSTATGKPAPAQKPVPASFVAGRYRVERSLGEGSRKRVFLAHDTRLARDVAFAKIRSEGLDALARERVTREAQAMGRLGAHPHLVAVFDVGDEGDGPFIVQEYMAGGDVAALLGDGPCPSNARLRSDWTSAVRSPSCTVSDLSIAT